MYNGYANAGTNVQQCKYNGSYAQKWYFYHIGNGEYFIASDTGSTNDGEYTYFNFVLDVVNGINEDEFRKYWKENAVRTYACSGKKALEDMFGVYAQDYVAGDVIQYGDSFLGLETSTEHTMYITGYKTQIVDGTLYPSYTVTYHSSDTLNKPLTELYQKYSNKYFRMYQIH